MSSEPPPFQEASRCDVCNCSFNTFRRRHHCRCCGRTLCAEHSANQMALPQFGLHSNVRVCGDCFNNSSRRPIGYGVIASASEVNALKDSFSALDVGAVADIKTEDTVNQTPTVGITDCKCGMPLCICQVSATPTTSTASQGNIMPNPIVNINPKPKKENKIPTSRASTSDNKQGYVTDVSSCPFGEIGPVYFLQRRLSFLMAVVTFMGLSQGYVISLGSIVFNYVIGTTLTREWLKHRPN